MGEQEINYNKLKEEIDKKYNEVTEDLTMLKLNIEEALKKIDNIPPLPFED